MTIYQYKAISQETNSSVSGVIEGISENDALEQLREKKLIIVSLNKSKNQPKGVSDSTGPVSGKKLKPETAVGSTQKTTLQKIISKIPFFGGTGISNQEIMLFTKKLATMIRAGLPIIDVLEMTESQVTNKKLKPVIVEILATIRSGVDLSGCFAKFPEIFDTIFINMIKAGEASGKLDIFLDKLSEILEKRQKIKSQIRGALMYPIVIFVIAIVITIFLLWKVVPVFEEMYGGMDMELPGPTLAILAVSKFIQGPGGLITLVSIFLFVSGFRYLMNNVSRFKSVIDGMTLKLPVFGNVIAMSTIARISLIKANLFAAGVDVLDILDIAKASTTNTHYIEALDKMKKGVFAGEDMSKIAGQEKVFPLTYSQLIAVGERTGNLEEMFSSIASYYEEEFDNIAKNIQTLIEPFSMVFIGGIVGVLLIAMYLPIFNAGSAIG